MSNLWKFRLGCFFGISFLGSVISLLMNQALSSTPTGNLPIIPMIGVLALIHTVGIMRYAEDRTEIHKFSTGCICGAIDVMLVGLIFLLFGSSAKLGATGLQRILAIVIFVAVFVLPPFVSPRIVAGLKFRSR